MEDNFSPKLGTRHPEFGKQFGPQFLQPTTPFTKIELTAIFYTKNLPILNCRSILENIYSTTLLLVVASTV